METKELVLGYWNARGLGEPIRMLMEHLALPYREELYSRTDPPELDPIQWTSKKFTLGLDFPNIPYLFDGSFKLTETFAIMRYLCNKHDPKLLGETLEERTIVNMLEGVLYDIYEEKKTIMFAPDLTQVPKRVNESMQEGIKKVAKFLEGKKYLIGDKLTFIDFYCVEVLEAINDLLDPIFKTYPILDQYYKRMMDIPNINKYRNSDKFLKDLKPYNSKIARIGTQPFKKDPPPLLTQ